MAQGENTTNFQTQAVDSALGYYVDGTQVIDSNGNLVESAGISLADGDSFDDTNGNEMLEFEVTASAVNHVGFKNAATGNNPIILAKGEGDTGLTFQTEDDEEMFIMNGVAAAVNHFQASSAATGAGPKLEAVGDDTNIDVLLAAKGTGGIQLAGDESLLDSNGNELVSFSATGSAVNEVTVTNSATGNAVQVSATGDDTDVTLALAAKGTGGIQFANDEALLDSNGNEQIGFVATGSAVNEVTFTNAATSGTPQMAATGDDADIDLGLAAKGTGNVVVQTGGLASGAIANSVYPVFPTATQENISAGTGGAINVTSYLTTIETDAGGDAYTLADGSVVGQIKRIQMITDGGGDGTVTPANFASGTTITYADVGDYADLLWTPGGWVAIALGNFADGSTAPVVA